MYRVTFTTGERVVVCDDNAIAAGLQARLTAFQLTGAWYEVKSVESVDEQ